MIEFERVSFGYGKQNLIDDLSVTLPGGRINTIIGPNGSGKTTLLNLAARLIRPDRGRILIDGADIAPKRQKDLARVLSFMRQGDSMLPITAGDLVLSGRYPYQNWGLIHSGQDCAAASRAMEAANCSDLREKRLDRLSGGERRRVFLAAALAQETDILLLDEPTAYLDIRAAIELMELVRNIRREQNKTVVMVLHDLDLALRYSDNIVLLNQGNVFAQGSARDIVDSGHLAAVFGVAVARFTRDGKHYYCFDWHNPASNDCQPMWPGIVNQPSWSFQPGF